MWNGDRMLLPVCSPPSSVWASEGGSSVPRGLDAVSSMRSSHGKALRMWKDDGPQCPLFTRESFLRKGMWASPRMWVPSLRTAVPCWCVCAMYDNVREAAQALVRNRSVTARRNFVNNRPPARLVFRHSTHAPSLVMLPPFVQRLSHAVRPSPSLVRVDAFNSPCCVGGVPRAQPGARLALPHTVRTSARLQSATLVLQRHLASILTHTNRTATLRTRTSSWPLPGITESSLSWSRRLLLSMST